MFAEKAVDLICQGLGNKAVGFQNGKVVSLELKDSAMNKKPIDLRLLQLAEMLAT
jgi:hypothetical protein